MQESNKSAAVTIGVIMLVVGALIGFGITKSMDHNDTNDMSAMTMSGSSNKASNLRADLVTLGVEHMTLTNQAVDAALDGTPNASAVGAALYANGTDIGAAVGSVYGTSAQDTFNSVWKLHLDDFVKYATADKQGDASAKSAALQDIDANYTKPLAQYLAKANPNLPEGTLETALRDHVGMTAQMIDYHVQGNDTAEQSELKMANKHMEGLFSTLAGAIVKQYPNKF
jgi:hypothetical protein